MNEQIEALAEQAKDYARHQSDYGYYTDADEFDIIFKQKFAELIVAECASKVDNILREKKDGGGTMGDEIREDFGVKECTN